jgi:hypothetical protein
MHSYVDKNFHSCKKWVLQACPCYLVRMCYPVRCARFNYRLFIL